MTKPRRNDPCPCGSGKKFKVCHGFNRPWPKPENIAAVFRNDREKKIAVVTRDIVLNQLTRDGPLIAASFDELGVADLREISAVYADAIAISWRFQIEHAADDDTLIPTCARLLMTAQETFIGSVDLARHGYRRQYGALVRNAVEALCTIITLMTEAGALDALHQKKLKSTHAVAQAKKAIPAIGYLYGLLSNSFVHVGTMHAAFEPLIRFRRGEESLGFLIPSMRSIAWLIYVVTELVFLKHVEKPRYWKKIGENELGYELAYDPSEDEKAWQKKFLETSYAELELGHR
ncbi:MAG: SEC-C domain-containing protein [Alphaproteobacteria bacterium]|nr:SEC-C domain-containing protein [Alphaproteobacteria bacterium]